MHSTHTHAHTVHQGHLGTHWIILGGCAEYSHTVTRSSVQTSRRGHEGASTLDECPWIGKVLHASGDADDSPFCAAASGEAGGDGKGGLIG